jgi:hypothetical protein
MTVERRLGCYLRNIRRADDQVLRQALNRAYHFWWRTSQPVMENYLEKFFMSIGFAEREPPFLPQQFSRIAGERTVNCDDGHVLRNCLSNEKPIHWVPVMRRQMRGGLRVTHGDR